MSEQGVEFLLCTCVSSPFWPWQRVLAGFGEGRKRKERES